MSGAIRDGIDPHGLFLIRDVMAKRMNRFFLTIVSDLILRFYLFIF